MEQKEAWRNSISGKVVGIFVIREGRILHEQVMEIYAHWVTEAGL